MIRPEYLQTFFIPKKPGKTLPKPDWSKPFAILTAHNPGGKRHDDAVNQLANRRLRTRLNQRRPHNSPPLVKIDAVSEDWSHEEKSFAVWGLDRTTAAKIGREFRQDAYFWVENNNVTVYSCISGKTKSIGRWKDRLRSRVIPFPIRIYVLELRREVLKDRSFLKQNPECAGRAGRGCLYVGSTDNIQKRIRIHRFGSGPRDNPRVRGSKLVKKYFRRRRKDLEPADTFQTSGHATLAEALEAEYLRNQRYRVYSN